MHRTRAQKGKAGRPSTCRLAPVTRASAQASREGRTCGGACRLQTQLRLPSRRLTARTLSPCFAHSGRSGSICNKGWSVSRVVLQRRHNHSGIHVLSARRNVGAHSMFLSGSSSQAARNRATQEQGVPGGWRRVGGLVLGRNGAVLDMGGRKGNTLQAAGSVEELCCLGEPVGPACRGTELREVHMARRSQRCVSEHSNPSGAPHAQFSFLSRTFFRLVRLRVGGAS